MRVARSILWLVALATVAAVVWWLTDTGAPASTDSTIAAPDGGPPPPPDDSDTGAVARRRVSGRVVHPSGRPQAGAGVAVFAIRDRDAALPEPLDQGFADADGRFVIDVVDDPDLAVGARATGLLSPLLPLPASGSELVLRLVDAYQVSGYVSDRAGPVSGCEVVLETMDERFGRITKTAADGSFRFAEVSPGMVRIVARDRRYRPAVRNAVAVGAGEAITLQFDEPGLTLAGSAWIDTVGGTPAAGARVRVAFADDVGRPRRGIFMQDVDVDANGGFEVFGLGPGRHRVEVGHADRSTVVRVVDIGDPSLPPLDFVLPDRAVVQGRLVGDSLAGLGLLVVSASGERARTRVDTGGRFQFARRFSLGPATLVCEDRSLCFERTSSRAVAIEVGGDQNVVLQVAPTMLLMGDVTDERGRPVAGAELFVDSEYLPGIDLLHRPVGVTDTTGRYQLHVASNQAVELTVRHGDYATQRVELPRQANGVQRPIVLARPGSVSGEVRRGGVPLPGAFVHLAPESSTRAWCTTGPAGEFTLHGLPEGDHLLYVTHGQVPEAPPFAVVVGSAADVQGVVLELPAARWVDGTVVDRDGRPVPGVLVSVADRSGVAFTTDAQGGFGLVVPEGDATLRVRDPRLQVERLEPLPAGVDRVRLVLPLSPHGSVVGRVVALPGRRAVPGGLVRIEPLDAATDGGAADVRWVTMPDGNLRIERFPAGRARLRVSCAGYVPYVTEVAVEPGETLQLGDCALEPGAVLRGVVRDEAGRPVAGARLLLGDELDLAAMDEAMGEVRSGLVVDARFGVRADLRGGFELRGITSQSRTVVVQAPGFATQLVQVEIPGDLLRRDPFVVTMTLGVDVIVQVLGHEGTARVGTTVALRRGRHVLDLGRTDADGRCRFQHLGPGDYLVSLPGFDASELVEVWGQQTHHVVLRAQ